MAGANMERLGQMVDDFDKLDGGDYEGSAQVVGNDADDDGDEHEEQPQRRQQRTDNPPREDKDADDDLIREAARTLASSKKQKKEEAPQEQQQQQQTQTQETVDTKNLRPLPNGLSQDAQGNLVDPRTGQLVAKHGRERRLYETNIRMRTQFERVNNELETARRQLDETRAASTYHTKFGLTNEDMAVGVPIIAEFSKDPVKAARKVVEMVMGMGHNLSDILGGNGADSIDMKAVSRMIQEQLQPLQELRQEKRQTFDEEQVRQRAEQAMQHFFDKHEYAEMHAQEIDGLLGRRRANDPEYTAENAYHDLRVFCAQRGLDFTRPLGPQIAAAQADDQGAQNTTQQKSVHRGGSLPNGRGGSSTSTRSVEDTEMADSRASWEDIIGRAMRHMRNG